MSSILTAPRSSTKLVQKITFIDSNLNKCVGKCDTPATLTRATAEARNVITYATFIPTTIKNKNTKENAILAI